MPPGSKHHRIPAPELAFDAPNLPFFDSGGGRAGGWAVAFLIAMMIQYGSETLD